MSSSSLSTKNIVANDSQSDYFLSSALVNDIERFATYAERLRRTLTQSASTSVTDGESTCVAVHSALSMVSQSVRDLLVRYPAFKTTQVLLPASQLIHSVKEINFDDPTVDAACTLACLEKLEVAVGCTLKQTVRRPTPVKYSSATMGHRIVNGGDGIKGGRVLIRRHSAFQPKGRDSTYVDCEQMDRMVADRTDGIDIAFDRGKAWAKYCKDLLNYVTRRVQLELEHAKRIQSLASQSKMAISEHYLPLRDVFESSFENDIAFCEQTYEAVKHVQDRFIKSLELRREEHERQRRALKNEWLRVTKQLKDTQQELQRARTLLSSRDDGYRKAQEIFSRAESTGPAVGSELIRRRKEMEKRRRNEEEALSKRDEARNQVERLEIELERRRQLVEDTKVRIVGQLRELVYRCDQTTKACSTHFFQAFANLWVPQPGKYHEFADATRTYIPGAEYMSFLQSLPRRTVSSGSLFRGENADGLSAGNQSASSSSVSSQRRNAIDMLDQEVIFERKQKKNSARLLEQAALEGVSTEAARSHRLQRTRQPSKCSHCEALSLLSTVQCVQCGMSWHKSCLPRISAYCGQSARGAEAARRTSIFGVALCSYVGSGPGHKVPVVLEQCVEELQRRGLKVKGLYRTCGVKSKIEQICEHFERCPASCSVELGSYHPMNIASVIKLYLRKLPEPLLTHELFDDWICLAEKNLIEEDTAVVDCIKSIVNELPPKNSDALKFLLLHLKRVTWFEMDNLMTASNLGAVISPSMIWRDPASLAANSSSFLSNAHLMSKAVELLIKYAFEIFDVDEKADRQEFFKKYPDIEAPPVDAEIDEPLGEGEGITDEDLLGDESDTVCLPFLPQPPTPDLLKNTFRNANSDDLSSGPGSARTSGSSQNISRQFWVSSQNSGVERTPPLRPRFRGDKKRSYTTSILVSPRADRKFALPQKQRSVEERKTMSICSGDVTLDVGKSQFVLPNTRVNDSASPTLDNDILTGLCRRLNIAAGDGVGGDSSAAHGGEQWRGAQEKAGASLCANSRALFPEADVSYI